MAWHFYRPGELPNRPKPKQSEHPPSYVVLEIYSKTALEAIEKLARTPSMPEVTRKELLEACKHKRSMNLPLARSSNIEDLEMEAERQGCDRFDILWDQAHGEGEPSL